MAYAGDHGRRRPDGRRRAGRRAADLRRPGTVDYPASFNYTSSVRAGVAALKDDIAGTATACPRTRFVLMGYSQGANVVGDVLAGSRTSGTSALPDELASRVSSVLLFGDPTFTAGESFNVTDGRASGVFARGTGKLGTFADRTRSYCNRNDRFCQSGSSVTAHLAYQKFLDQATAFAAATAA